MDARPDHPGRVHAPVGSAQRATRGLAWFEAVKGVLVLAVAAGCLSLVHPRAEAALQALLHDSHLHLLSRVPRVFAHALLHPDEAGLVRLATEVALYGAICLIEAWGLYAQRRWGQWLAALISGWFIPMELQQLVRHPTPLVAVIVLANVAILGVMVWALIEGAPRVSSVARPRTAETTPPPTHESMGSERSVVESSR